MDRDRSQERQTDRFVPDSIKVPHHAKEDPPNLDEAKPTRGRAGESSQQSHVEEVEQPAAERPSLAPRTPYRDRHRTYYLRESENLTLAHIGMFRTVRVHDLAEHLYAGDEGAASRDLRNLTAQGLVQRNTLRGKQTHTRVTLTPEARRLLEKNRPSSLHPDQAFYAGFVKPREAKHDADLYRMYQKEAEHLLATGSKNLRVILDFELKKTINCELARMNGLSKDEKAAQREQLARQLDLRVVNEKIPVPDVRIEYEKPDGEIGHVDLELATEDYRAQTLREKVRAGFVLYAPREELSPVRRALPTDEILREIFSL
jgi:DNA-binding MarR family transcriptional regulator